MSYARNQQQRKNGTPTAGGRSSHLLPLLLVGLALAAAGGWWYFRNEAASRAAARETASRKAAADAQRMADELADIEREVSAVKDELRLYYGSPADNLDEADKLVQEFVQGLRQLDIRTDAVRRLCSRLSAAMEGRRMELREDRKALQKYLGSLSSLGVSPEAFKAALKKREASGVQHAEYIGSTLDGMVREFRRENGLPTVQQ